MNSDHEPRHWLEQLYRGAIAMLQPDVAISLALDDLAAREPTFGALHLLAIGKAASAMTRAAQHWCAKHGTAIIGGIAVCHVPWVSEDSRLISLTGDHPMPAEHSRAAAEQIGRYIDEQISDGDRVLLLLSGGASALIGAPRHGIDDATFSECLAALLGAGLTIDDMNTIRRTLTRWGGGKLGAALLSRSARTDVLVISDVMGDNLAAIGSGPCVPDETRDVALSEVLQRATISNSIRPALRAILDLALADDAATATYSPDAIPHHIISSNSVACESVLRLARDGGAHANTGARPLDGDAHTCGAMIVHELLTLRAQFADDVQPMVVCWGGEPTVTLPANNQPPGGRMQALALAAARALHDAGSAANGITILAAGTDGRDGITDAAGVIISHDTWRAIAAAGRDPSRDLAEFRSHDALREIGALIPAFASGTNVNDIVIALVNASTN